MTDFDTENLQAAFAGETLGELERRLISGCLGDNKAAAWLHELTEGDFSDPVASAGFTAIRIAQTRGIDLDEFVIRQIMADMGRLGEFSTLMLEVTEVVSYPAIRAMVAYVKDESGRRAFRRAALQIQRESEDRSKPLSQVLESATRALGRAYGSRAKEEAEPEKLGFLRMSEVLIEDRLADEAAKEKGLVRQLLTGLAGLDKMSPVEEGDYVLLQGLSGEGKSLLATQLCRGWGQTRPGYFWSGELTKKQIYRRAAGQELGINPRDVTALHLVEMSEKYARQVWVDNESPITFERLIQKIELFLLAHPDAAWFAVDYLQLTTEEDFKLVTKATRAFRALCLKHNLVGLVLAQSDEGKVEERKCKKPRVTDVRGSRNLVKDASKIWAIHRPSIHDKSHDKRDVRIVILKERDGDTSGKEIRLTFDGSCVTFRDGAPLVEGQKKSGKKAEQQKIELTPEDQADVDSMLGMADRS